MKTRPIFTILSLFGLALILAVSAGQCWAFGALGELLNFLRRHTEDWEAPGQPDE